MRQAGQNTMLVTDGLNNDNLDYNREQIQAEIYRLYNVHASVQIKLKSRFALITCNR